MFKTSSESRLVGESCRRNTDCVSGAYCETGRCRCLGNYVEMKDHCWRRVNPEESGCTYDVQCDAIWPGSFCQYSICKCPLGKMVAATREGAVCHSPGECPTGSVSSALLNRNSLSLANCYFFDGEDRRAGKFIGCDDYPEVHECIEGLCCPTRALTCIQPADPGDGGNETSIVTPRWYYDSITGSCQQFNYSGQGGNSNNFLTKQQCESYCEARCARGQPQLDFTVQDSDPLASLTLLCQRDSDCDEDRFSCQTRSSTSSCCPKAEFICSEHGGLLGEQVDLTSSVSTTIPFSAGSSRNGVQPATRWYWDDNERRCRTFQYLGQGGNFNNFLSEQHCLGYCTKALCPYGTPLRISSGSLIECSVSSQCPRSHQCVSGACCPTSATICNQPLSEGVNCLSEEVPRFWFDPSTGSCQQFSYRGCQGNANNFHTHRECQTFCSQIEEEPKCVVGEALRLESGRFWKCGVRGVTCPNQYECLFDGNQHGCCPTQAYTCSQMPDEGRSCSPGISIRWFYDNKHAQCRSFSYRGCDGNSNNFASQKDCEDYCVQKLKCPPPYTNPFEAPQFCSPQYKSCQEEHECVSVTSSNHVCCAPQVRPSLRILITKLCGDRWKP
ncbi:unnamed protein product, partial [Mesorhabditis belari]|uniref:BPTI/Kunitz inhibitor domain-containing protein n=1 Tax=Mesorhabditis belari TaxID=2138241 RepID=A0AAF3ERF2_9BILA